MDSGVIVPIRTDGLQQQWKRQKKSVFRVHQGEEGEVKFYVDFMLWDRLYAVDPHRIEAKKQSWEPGSVDCC